MKYLTNGILPAIQKPPGSRDLAALHFIFNLAIRLGYLKDNPATGVKMLAEPQDRTHVLSHHEEKKYLVAASRTLRDVGVLILATE